jgi:6-phosphogluconolactonase
MLTRRRFLAFLSTLAASAASAQALPKFHLRRKKVLPPPPVFVYFGTDTAKGASKGIYQSRFDPAKGLLSPPVLAAATVRPSFLALSPMRSGSPRFLYAVNAVNDPNATVTSFAIDPKSGALRLLGQVPSAGAGPAFISVDASGHSAFVADYLGSGIASYRIQPDGALSQPVDRISFKDREDFGALGPNSAHQDASHPHCATLSPDNRFLLVCDLGTDHISVFLVDPDTGRLSNHKLFTNNRPGSGPRHIAFHPNARWAYSINELDSSIDHFLWSATRFSETPQGMLITTTHTIKTIAPDFPPAKNAAAELAISPDGNFLYASNRGEDTLVAFSISARDGHLTLLQRISCGGKGPRQFAITSGAEWLLCGNQDSANVTLFRRDAATGKLSGPTQTVPLDSPLFALFA